MWDKLEVFYHVAQMGSFTKAAHHLNITQSSLSRHVQTLENNLGCKVFVRNQRGVELTQKGQVVFEAAKQIYLCTKTMTEEISESEEIEGRIRISTTYALANYILMDHLLEFKKLHPKIYFEIVCSDSLVDIIQNEVDIALRPYVENAQDLEQVPIITLQPKLFASQSYIDQYGEPKTVEDLVNHKFIAYSRPANYPYGDAEWYVKLNSKISDGNITLRVNSVEGMFAAAEKGLGIISSYDEMKILQDSNLKLIFDTARAPVYKESLVYPKHMRKTKRITQLIVFLKNKLKKT